MASRPPGGRPRSGAKPGATYEQTDRRERFERARRDSLRSGDTDGPVIMYGWHTVTAALRNPQRHIRKLLVTENAARKLTEEGIEPKLAPELVRPYGHRRTAVAGCRASGSLSGNRSAALTRGRENSGATASCWCSTRSPIRTMSAPSSAQPPRSPPPPLSPPQRHSPDATGALAKSASGALEHVPLVSVQNLARGLAALKESGFLVGRARLRRRRRPRRFALAAPLALVLGAEGKSLRQLTKEICDHVARIDLPGEIKSLNVSNAAALGLYVASRGI